MIKETIFYIGYGLPDKQAAGVRGFANALALYDYGYDVKLISKDNELMTDFDVNEGISTWHLARPKSIKEWTHNLLESKQYTDIIDKVDDVKVVIAYALPAVSFLKLRKYCHKRGIKLICETAEWQKWENLGNLNPIARLVRISDICASMHFAYKKSDGLIVTSHTFSNHFKQCVPTLVLPTLQWNKIEFSQHIVINSVRKFIYAGALGFRKDLLCHIIRAFGKLHHRDFEFNILGLLKCQYLERFPEDEALLKRINFSKEKIKFWGKVLHSEVLEEVSKSDFSVIIRENLHRNNIGFPTKFGESINCGTPVIVSDFSDVVYYTEKYQLGIVADIHHIENALNDALDMDDDSLLAMHQSCRDCDEFYYKSHSKEIGEFVKNIINR